jgi:hypothetical protein
VKRASEGWYDDGGADPQWAAIIGRPAKIPRGYTEPAAFYGQVTLAEPEDAAHQDWVVELDCFAADWFDAFAADLHDMPDWSTAAAASRARLIEFGLSRDELLDLFGRVLGPAADPGSYDGAWLKLALQLDALMPGGMPVRVFLPPANSTDMTQVGWDGREADGVRIVGLAAPGPAAASKLGLLAA